jgi:hypothetical protein
MIFEDMNKTMPERKYEDLQTLFKTAPPDEVQDLNFEVLREHNPEVAVYLRDYVWDDRYRVKVYTVFWNTLVYPDSATTHNHENAEKWSSVYAWLIHDGRRGLGCGARIV